MTKIFFYIKFTSVVTNLTSIQINYLYINIPDIFMSPVSYIGHSSQKAVFETFPFLSSLLSITIYKIH